MDTRIRATVQRVKDLEKVVFVTATTTYDVLGVTKTMWVTIRIFDSSLMDASCDWYEGWQLDVTLRVTPDLRPGPDGKPQYDKFQFSLLQLHSAMEASEPLPESEEPAPAPSRSRRRRAA